MSSLEISKVALRWPITATAKTKRNTVKKEILINEKKFCSYKKGLLSNLKKFVYKEKRFTHTEK